MQVGDRLDVTVNVSISTTRFLDNNVRHYSVCVYVCVCVCVCVCVRLWNVKIASNRKRCQDNEIALVIGYKVRG